MPDRGLSSLGMFHCAGRKRAQSRGLDGGRRTRPTARSGWEPLASVLSTQSCVSDHLPSSVAFKEESGHNSENQEQQQVTLFAPLEFVFVGWD